MRTKSEVMKLWKRAFINYNKKGISRSAKEKYACEMSVYQKVLEMSEFQMISVTDIR